jgi:general stress protein CsbA
MLRLTSGQLVALGMMAIIVGLAVWRLASSTQTWWTIAVAVLAIVGVGVFAYYMISGKQRDDE